ncbi:MAG TPA: hypothetical protein VKI44_09795 [Acetobacteraceae bacterium]|nr:hypothetical protein [Acetobacteraceae bacterium]
MDIEANSPPADHCRLQHRVFTSFGDPLFRRSATDGMPVMVVKLGEKEAAMPLRALQREFGIADDSDDGQMLGLVAQSLDFVAGLRIGDVLPAEVLSGEASWEPDQVHLRIANARLQSQLVAWLSSGTDGDRPNLDADALLQVADDPARKQQVQVAFTKAAETLGLPSREAVVRLVEELAHELAYIEALRDRLLRRVKRMAEKLNRMAQTYHGDGVHLETLTQVRRLTCVALKQISHRFDDLDAQTGEVMAALRNAHSECTFIRSNRDWLYRTQRAWQSLLQEWDVAGIGFDEGIMPLLNRSYQFLAPRFMPVTEWISLTRPATRKQDAKRRMVW